MRKKIKIGSPPLIKGNLGGFFQANVSRILSNLRLVKGGKPRLLLLILFFFTHTTMAMSEERLVVGTVININYQYKLAFTELNKSDFKVGDIVKVFKEKDFITYLQVIQTSDVTSKLAPIISGDQKSAIKKFLKIEVGNSVIKISKPYDKKLLNLLKETKETKETKQTKKQEPIDSAKAQNCVGEVKQLRGTILQLKKKLENMTNILEGNTP